MLAPAIVPAIALHLGWHWAFIFAGLAGLLWVAAWLPLFDAPERSRRVSATELAYIESDAPDASEGGAPLTWGQVLRHRQAWSFVAAKFLTDPVWCFLLIWLPDFFKKNRHLDIKNSWVYLVTIYALITVLGIAGGWVTGWLTTRGWSVTRARKTGMFAFALCVVPIAFVSRVGDWGAVFLIALAGAAHQAWSANLYTTVSDMFEIRRINEGIEKLADGKTVFYLNVNDKLANPDGVLLDGMAVDKLHLTVKGYQVWADGLRPLLTKFLGPPAKTDHAPPPTGDPSASRR